MRKRTLRSELGVHGVNVTCLAPGATATALYDPSVVPVERGKRLGIMMDAKVVAEAGLRAMFAGKGEHIPGLLTRVMTVLAVLTPQWLIDFIRRRALCAALSSRSSWLVSRFAIASSRRRPTRVCAPAPA
jgi:short-subunit dehydrogenase